MASATRADTMRMWTQRHWPTFGRDVPDAACGPSANAAADNAPRPLHQCRPARPISRPCSATPERDPAWFWGAAAEDLSFAWQRKPTSILDTSGGVEWSRLVERRRVQLRGRGRVIREPRASRWRGHHLGGRDGSVRRFTNAELKADVDRAAAMIANLGIAEGDRVGIFHAAPATRRSSLFWPWQTEGDLHPDLLRYAAPAVASRLNDAGATLLVTVDGTLRRGAQVRMKETSGRRGCRVADRQARAGSRTLSPLAHRRCLGGRSGSLVVDEMADPDLQPIRETRETDPERPT
jgi:acetyl-CoA synthetase